MKENLVFNPNRLSVGFILLIILFCSYTYNFDIFLFLAISIFTLLDIYYSKLLRSYYLFIAIIFLSLFYILIKLNNELLIFFTIFAFISFTLSLNKNLYKIFFPISILFFNTCFLYLLLYERDIFYLVILISFINDSFAYFFGNLLKGPPIIPKISPKKTWSGTITSISISTILLIYFDFNIFLSLILSVSLFLGDLHFSLVKRRLQIKDFSNFLGSHGGILDRIDSMFIFTIIICFYNLLI